jgi:hypothetical protein
MSVKLAFAIVLGLVFQLAQMLPAAVLASPCAAAGASCECCVDWNSCCCATTPDSDRKPAPAPLDNSRLLKLPAMKSCDARIALVAVPEDEAAAAVSVAPQTGPVAGFSGLR